MVPFERALVGFYRPSIVTFPLSLPVSEILLLLFSSMPLFPTPLLFGLEFRVFPLEYRSVMLVSAESQVPKLVSREIIFAEFQRL